MLLLKQSKMCRNTLQLNIFHLGFFWGFLVILPVLYFLFFESQDFLALIL